MAYLTIDPGLGGTGWAVWTNDWILTDYGVVFAGTKNKINAKQDLAKKLYAEIHSYNIKRAYIEYPAKFSGVKGDMVAGGGSLVKLAEFVGYLRAYLDMRKIETLAVPVIEWKGQMPKEAVKHRIRRVLPEAKPTSHDWDAIGIGLYLKGDF